MRRLLVVFIAVLAVSAAAAGQAWADPSAPPLLDQINTFKADIGGNFKILRNRLYAVSHDQKTIVVYTLDGRLQRRFGEGQIGQARYVYVSAVSGVWVADDAGSDSGRIDHFALDGSFIGSFVGRDFARIANTFYPREITETSDGRLVVITIFDGQIFNTNGQFQGYFLTGTGGNVDEDIATLPTGELALSRSFWLSIYGADGQTHTKFQSSDFPDGADEKTTGSTLTMGEAVLPDGSLLTINYTFDSRWGGARLLWIGSDGRTVLGSLAFPHLASWVATDDTGAIYLDDGGSISTYEIPTADQYAADARYYRPYLYFDSSERWRPLNVNRFLREPDNRVCSRKGASLGNPLGTDPCGPKTADNPSAADCTDWTCLTPAGSISWLEQHSNDQSHYLDISDNRSTPGRPACHDTSLNGQMCDFDGGATNAIYYHAYPATSRDPDPQGTVYFDYWEFYRWNQAIDTHEGDWEGLLVAADPTCAADNPNRASECRLGGAGAKTCAARDGILWVGIRAHQYSWRYLCGVMGFTGGHVHSYVAAGSHAEYPRPCSGSQPGGCDQDTRQLDITSVEGRYNGARPWAINNSSCDSLSSDCVLSLDSPSNREWSQWSGRWGKDGWPNALHSAPLGPLTHYGDGKDPVLGYKDCYRTVFDGGLPTTETNACDTNRPVSTHVDPCSSWFAPGIIAVACSAKALAQGLDPAKSIGSLSSSGAIADSNSAVAQLAAATPLHPGSIVSITGTGAPDTEVAVRVQDGPATQESLFPVSGGTSKIAVTAPPAGGGAPQVVLTTASGKKEEPVRTGVMVAPVTKLRATSTTRKTTVRFTATGTSAIVRVYSPKSRLLGTKTVKTRPHQATIISLSTRAKPATVSVISVYQNHKSPPEQAKAGK